LSAPGQTDWSRVRMGVEVPITTLPPPDAKQTAASAQAPTVQYRPFGTNIDCIAQQLDNGRFKVSITIDESTPYSDEDKSRFTSSTNENRATGITPVFRSIRLSNVLLLKDGQSEQMSSATDRFSGEVVKVDVTLSVIKP
jgi:Flp pilus assembly secretin CpaC